MKPIRCIVYSYTYWGETIGWKECPSIREALKVKKEMKKGLSCYTAVIYNAETGRIIAE